MKRKCLIGIFLWLAPVIYGIGQPVRQCATMEVFHLLQDEYPEYRERRAAIELETQTWIDRHRNMLHKSLDTRIVPVVVHVIYNRSTENISYDQIVSQMDVLNQDFRKILGTPGHNDHPRGADCGIEFRLALIDPNGGATDGVTRTKTTKSSFSTNDAMKKSSSGGHDPWPTNKYLNIWVCKLSDDILGYAQLPGGPTATDGVVIDYRYFGNTGTATAPFDMGRSTTHEVGHYFNLLHTWGDYGGCDDDDFVDDTPNSAEPNYECPHGHKSCGSIDMIENYMDYTDDACMNLFTIGQSARMNAILEGTRSALISWHPWEGGTNLAPVALANGPYAGKPDEFIRFSSNGSSDPDGSIASYLWDFGDGETSSTANPRHRYTRTGLYEVRLTVIDNDGLSATAVTSAVIRDEETMAPVAEANGPYTGQVGQSIRFSSAGSFDSDGEITGYLWDFGDGFTSSQPNPTHVYSAVGIYNVMLRITDSQGLAGTDKAVVEVIPLSAKPEVIFAEGFEFMDGVVPGPVWSSRDFDDKSGRDYWGDQHVSWGAKVHSGEWSIYNAEWSNLWGTQYDNDMNTVVQNKRPVDLTGYSRIEISFWHWYRIKNGDYFSLEIKNTADRWEEVKRWSGLDGNSWQQSAFYVQGVDNLVFRFRFYSNASGTARGVYIDDIVISGVKTGERIDGIAEPIVSENLTPRILDVDFITAPQFELAKSVDNVQRQKRLVDMGLSLQVENYPNPFNPTTTILYSVPEQARTCVTVFNMLGQAIAKLVEGEQAAGIYQIQWDAGDLPSGLYFAVVEISSGGDNTSRLVRKMQLLK
ncbi:PKD domain-containing protein [candidate division KSB1 bacterium]|nr:PKD domain-containing protein [candidate division KSB1 bacterium]